VSLGFQSFFAAVVVLALVGAFAWLVRRGAFSALRQGSRAITVETAVPIGERRSLIIVAVEGRRLLLGLTPGQISMVTELGPAAAPAPIEPGSGGPERRSFEQELLARARGALGLRRTIREGRPGDILRLSAQES
jgi:flagellar protein FliO/FliZ